MLQLEFFVFCFLFSALQPLDLLLRVWVHLKAMSDMDDDDQVCARELLLKNKALAGCDLI